MFLVGLTGGIATGKSAVSLMLRRLLQCEDIVIDADKIAREGELIAFIVLHLFWPLPTSAVYSLLFTYKACIYVICTNLNLHWCKYEAYMSMRHRHICKLQTYLGMFRIFSCSKLA